MNIVLARHVDKVIDRAKNAIDREDIGLAWRLLEDAHIFSQSLPAAHLYVHWEMFRLAVRQRSYKEIFGQIVRFLLAAPASIFKLYPQGNTGRSDVGMFAPMPIPEKISAKMRELEKLHNKIIENGGQPPSDGRQHPLTRR